jgi:hypothetical protein
MSLLDPDTKKILDNLYTNNHIIIVEILNKIVSNKASMDISQWVSLIISQMVNVEKIAVSGVQKRLLVIELIILVIERDLLVSADDKANLISLIRTMSPSIIELVIYASQNINKTTTNCFKKCFK